MERIYFYKNTHHSHLSAQLSGRDTEQVSGSVPVDKKSQIIGENSSEGQTVLFPWGEGRFRGIGDSGRIVQMHGLSTLSCPVLK